MKAVLVPPFLSDVVILDGQASATELLETFADKILEHQKESEEHSERKDDESGSAK